jgi:hypothetical protein
VTRESRTAIRAAHEAYHAAADPLWDRFKRDELTHVEYRAALAPIEAELRAALARAREVAA